MMRRMHPLAICGVATMIALALGTGAASAEDKTFELKLSHWVPPTHPLQKAIEQWGADVEQASGGTIKYKVFPSQQLGKAFDHYDMARDGIADFTYVNPGYQPGRFPIIAAYFRYQASMARIPPCASSTPGIGNTRRPR